MIRVLIAEDSVTTRELLVELLSACADISVVGQARNGIEALELTKTLRPQVIVMDIRMPKMDGFEATRRIMVEAPTPIVIVSASYDVRDVEVSMHALRAGALTAIPKPRGPRSSEFEQDSARFVETVRSMSQVKVVRRWAAAPPAAPRIPVTARPDVRPKLVAIAASTGGPAALQLILSQLPADFPVPIVIVQHIARGFIDGFATWLNTAGALRVTVARDREPLVAGMVYLSPDDRHLGVSASGRAGVALADGPPINGFRPSATHLFSSVASQFGAAVVAVVLTGMGSDGIDGLRAVKAAGGLVIAQDEATSVVFGMPAEAIHAGLADWTEPVGEVAATLCELLSVTKEASR